MKMLVALTAGASMLATAAIAQMAPSTDDFVAKAAAGSATEVQAGQLAAQKASDKSVKAFGQRMVKDHGKAGKELMAILKKQGKTPPMDKPSPEGKSMIDKLNAAQGADFDRMYVDAMVEDHDKDVQEFAEYAKFGDDKQVKAFAKKTLAVIKMHDKMIHDIQSKMQKAAAR